MGWATMRQRPVHFNEDAPWVPTMHRKSYGRAACGAFSAGTMHARNGLVVTCRRCIRARRAPAEGS